MIVGNLINGYTVAYKLALNRNVLGVIGHSASDITIEASRAYNSGGKLLASPLSTSDTITSMGYPCSFMITPSNSQMAKNTAKYLSSIGKKRIAIFYEDTAYGRSLAGYF